jgi:Ca2+-binding EF-hand superfamily protein
MMIRTMATLTVALAFAACATVASTVGFPVADDDDNNMISSTEFSEVWADFDLFENFDDDDNNTVSRTEYTEAVDAIYEIDAYFRGLDRDRNGTLSRDEFINGWFTMFDTDRNGSLNRSEYRSAMDALNFEL